MDLSRLRVGVIGGGVGGLAAAVAMSRLGATVHVFERAIERRREGIALLVWSAAMRALDRLGVYAPIRARATPIEITEVRTPRGDVLSQLPIGQWAKTPEYPTVAVRRPDIVAALAAALPAERVHVGVALSSFDIAGARVIARFSERDPVELDMMVGADGINSTVRAQLLGASPPRTTNQYAWVGLARDVSHLLKLGITTATVGRGPRFWSAPLVDGHAFWYATLHDAPADPTSVREVARCYDGWHAPIQDLFAATRDDDVAYTRILDRPPSERWGTGPVTLLGDAAHASTPDLGQGACQAIESAAALGTAMSRASDVASGLRAYEAMRMERTATISRLCWLTSLNSTARNPALCAVRDAVVKAGLPTIARGPLTWIMAGQPC